jgi:peptidoglycan L-alanyl-D-glutamate endopeptidase CwlK
MSQKDEVLIDKPSQDRIALLHPKIREEVATILREANIALTGRASVRISQGLRTISEQNALYAQGRTDKTKKIVTNAKGGSSFHNYGLAVDIVLILDGKTASWDDKTDFDGDRVSDWMEVVAIFKKYGYVWGGDFRSIKDSPHFEKAFGFTTKQLLQKVNNKDFIKGSVYVNL